MEGPDHKVSANLQEFKEMTRAIRNIEEALGDGIKKVTESEKKNIKVVRKIVVAKRDIKKGDIFGKNNLTTKRANKGIEAKYWNIIEGKKAKKDFKKDDAIEI